MISFRWDTFFLSIKKKKIYIYIYIYIPTMNYLHPNVQCVYEKLEENSHHSQPISYGSNQLVIKRRQEFTYSISYQEQLIKFKDNALCLVSQLSIKRYLEAIALEPNNGLLIHGGNSNSLPLQQRNSRGKFKHSRLLHEREI